MTAKQRNHTPCSTGRRARTRGAASVEAVIVLPFFVMLFVGLLYVRDRALGKQSAELTARTCAWMYSANNCSFKNDADHQVRVPPECEAFLRKKRGSGEFDLEAAAGDQARRLVEGQGLDSIERMVFEVLNPLITEAFHRVGEAKAEAVIDRPRMFGGGEVAVPGRYQLPCNLEPADLAGQARSLWNAANPL